MRKTNCNLRMLGVLLGLQVAFSVSVHAQSSYAYARKNVKVAEQKANDKVQPEEGQEKQTLFNVLKELNRTRGIYFLFSDQTLGTKIVNALPAGSGSVEKTLQQVLMNTGLKFKKVNEKTFVILSASSSTSALDPKPVDFTENMLVSPIAENLIAAPAFAPVTGKVQGSDGAAISGVSVTVKGTKRGTSTNAAGEFTIDARPGDVLVISYIGFRTQEVAVGNGPLDIRLQASDLQLNEVVVTALGIQHKAKDLTYATQKLANSDLTTVKDANFVNSLTGKVAGVTITKSASGLGGSARVVLRGNKSTQNNQVLYVIDGIPMANYSPAQPGDVWGQSSGAGSSGRDGGDGISNINPDDIESITILKGASGAALYGSAAANGVIVISTKSGKAGRTRINVSSDLTAEKPMYYPELQFKYGQGGAGLATNSTDEHSWGPVVNAADHVKPFFQTGLTEVTSVSLSGGTDKAQTYFSYGNTSSKGIEPTSTFIRHIFNFRETQKFLNDKLTADANINFIDQEADNRPVSGLYANPLTGLEIFPRGLDFNKYKNYLVFSQQRNLNIQNWFDISPVDGSGGEDHEQNPYWVLNRMPRVDKRDRVIGNLTLKYHFTDWLSLQARGNIDKSWDTYDSRMYAGTQSVQAPPDGRYTYANNVNTQLYGDAILMANKDLSPDWTLQANLGTSITDNRLTDIDFDTNPSDASGLSFANKFGLQFIVPSALVSNQWDQRTQLQSVFGSVGLGFKQFLFFDLTARNDWSSTFAFTPTMKSGYFYYSAGANLVLSDAVTMPEAVSFAKFRISYAKVGNAVSIYATHPPDNFALNQSPYSTTNTKAPLPGTYLQPEDNRSFEAGTEWRFVHDRVGVDFTYYKNNNYRQYMEVAAPLGSGYSTYYLNLGNIQNTGVEITAFVVPVQTKNFKWTSTLNYALNKNLVVKLTDPSVPGGNPQNGFLLNSVGVNNYQSEIKEGGSWGDIYGYSFARNPKDGTILVDATGAASKAVDSTGSAAMTLLGNPNPKYTLGWNNSFDIGKFTVNFLIDGRFGGKVLSETQAVLDVYGASKASGAARDAGGVNIKATNSATGTAFSGLLPAQNFYQSVGDRNGITEYYMYSATAVRLRELAVGYNIHTGVSWINSMRLSVIGRNLFFIHKDAPFDPEVSMATSNMLQGIENFSQPSTRSIGASLKIGF